jgi:hypothetical protein
LLPAAVKGRPGKVAYDGVWMRAYAANRPHIAQTFARVSAVLAHIGVKPDWLLRRVEALGDWRPVSDREVLALYAVATWLIAWGIETPRDVQWVS